MTLREIRDILEADVLCGRDQLDTQVLSACGSDFMSDVLASSPPWPTARWPGWC